MFKFGCIDVGWLKGVGEEGFRNVHDKLILMVILPKGFMFSQDMKIEEGKIDHKKYHKYWYVTI